MTGVAFASGSGVATVREVGGDWSEDVPGCAKMRPGCTAPMKLSWWDRVKRWWRPPIVQVPVGYINFSDWRPKEPVFVIKPVQILQSQYTSFEDMQRGPR